MPAKTTAKPQPTAQPEAPGERLDLTTDLQALAKPRPFGNANLRPVPPEVIEFVDAAYQAWRENPLGWQAVTLSGPEAVAEVFQLARQYASRRSIPVTVQRKKSDNPAELVYRVRDKIRQKRSAKSAADAVPSQTSTDA